MNRDIHKLNILICDDSMTNNLILGSLLEDAGFKSVQAITDPRRVLPMLEAGQFDLLMLDVEMPYLSGLQVLEMIEASTVSRRLIPVMVLTSNDGEQIRNQALTAGAQDFLHKPFDHTEVVLRVKNILRVRVAYLNQLELAKQLEMKVAERTRALSDATDVLIERLAMAGEMRDNETGKHVIRVGKYSRVLAEAYGQPQEWCYAIEKAAPLHDVGKIGISDTILLKPGKLTPEERTVMETHAELGGRLLQGHGSDLVEMAARIALTHHEKWDGSGYPNQLMGEVIPLEGRIAALADVFDALTTVRPYKRAWTVEEALTFINEQQGKHFDPMLVQLMNEHMDQMLLVRELYKDDVPQS